MENKRIRKQICFYPGFHLSYYQTYSDFHFELGIPVNFKTSNLRIFLIHIPMMYGEPAMNIAMSLIKNKLITFVIITYSTFNALFF